MAVLVTAEVTGQTQQGYDGMLGMLQGPMKQAPGFILHAAHPVDGGWRILEMWDSKAQSNEWYAKNVAPNLPPGVHPKRTVQELHSLIQR
jgi:hypothetical protein